MGQVLHGSATTTEAVRRAIQHSQESLRALAKRYGVNQKTVAKWRMIPARDLAGAGGIEPPNGGIKIRCLTAWRRPSIAGTPIASRRCLA